MKKKTPPPPSQHRLKILEIRQKIADLNVQIEHYRRIAKAPKKGGKASVG
jgi:hypothetical protein